MTRNEWIAETAARLAATRTSDPDTLIVRCALDLAECLELKGYAPWLDSAPPAPALTGTAAKVVEADNAVVEAADTWASTKHGQDEAAVIALYRAVLSRRDAIRDHRAAQPGGA